MSIEAIVETISKNLWWILGTVFGIMLIQAILMAMGIRNPIIGSLSSMGLDYVLPFIFLVILYERGRKIGNSS